MPKGIVIVTKRAYVKLKKFVDHIIRGNSVIFRFVVLYLKLFRIFLWRGRYEN